MKTQKELDYEFEQGIIKEVIEKIDDFEIILDEEMLVEVRWLREWIDDNLEKPLKYQKVLYAHGYPRSVENGFLDKLVSCSGNFVFIKNYPSHPYPFFQFMIIL